MQVLLPIPLDKPLQYQAEETLELGTFVVVPFRGRELVGVVWSHIEDETLESSKIKKIISVIDNVPKLPEDVMQFVSWMAKYNLAPLGMVLKMAMLKNLELIKPKQLEKVKALQPGMANLPNITLNEEQNKAALGMMQSLDKHSVMLLEGVTGSGKTETYSAVMREILKQSADDLPQVLILLPEIVLTTQLLERFRKNLGFEMLEWHSSVTPSQKRNLWLQVIHNKAQLIIGARSALMLPFRNLRLIVVDEEHDSSFKQEEGVIYNARDMAIVKAKLLNIPVILSSATPSIETAYNVKEGKYQHFLLKNRYGDAILPKISTIDLNQEKVAGKRFQGCISKPLRKAMAETIKQGKQAMLFLNKLGYARITMCVECGSKVMCENCSIYMVEHKATGKLHCHYCSFTMDIPEICTKCQTEESYMTSYGVGVERVEEEVLSFLPKARIATMTSETIANKNVASAVIDKIMQHQIDIIIGTQMVAKGLHFPRLHLVGIIETDISLATGDLRSVENTYHLLHQVTGRAGRESVQGHVMLQTYDPANIIFQQLQIPDFWAFADTELESRKKFGMPPYTRLAIITGSCYDEVFLLSAMLSMAKRMPSVNGVEILGPAPAPISRIRKKYRYRFILNAQKRLNLQQLITDWLNKCAIPSKISIRVDIDPYSFG